MHQWWLSLSDPAPLLQSGDHWWRPVPRGWEPVVEKVSHLSLSLLPATRYPREQWLSVVKKPGPWGHVTEADVVACLAHEAPLPLSYPHEWGVDRWYQVADFALSLSLALYTHGLRFKRFSPWDFHFHEGQPRFHNWFQLEEAPAEEAALPSFPTFLRGFLYPLLASRELGMEPRMWAMNYPRGIPSEVLYRMAGWSRRWRHPFLSLVCLPYWMERFTRRSRRPPRTKPDRARKAVEGLHHQSLQWLKRLAPAAPQATRLESGHWKEREQALEAWVREHRPARVGDLYCRTGHLARGVHRLGPRVTGMDPEERCIRRAVQSGPGVEYLVTDVTAPSPAFTFGVQALAFADRYRHHWDMVVAADRWLHHWRESCGLPCSSAFALLHHLTREWAVLEAYPVGEGAEKEGEGTLRQLAAPWFTVEDTRKVGQAELWLLKARSL